ncbi:glutaredoxin family protein [Microbacterium telephonicum]|uniref:Ribonucleoside-diphosphate reductase class Ib glutaredoxin subunit n=1 Tax=Microbacterium telephonicum TaxID=1714841 RepID=A0A498BV00_9MICO|nr:glutaredoxin family protein [Microbacterium telephonicum]RLK47644.1 ribonucleoside-diphosphate reductase class Ib glutaredoxin subunit [Microbacterium telephonicum]
MTIDATRPAPTGDITVWTKPNCVQCRLVKHRLTQAGVTYTERDITAPEHAADLAHFKSLGYMSAPITEYEDTAFPGFVPAEIDRIAAAWKTAHPAEVNA